MKKFVKVVGYNGGEFPRDGNVGESNEENGEKHHGTFRVNADGLPVF